MSPPRKGPDPWNAAAGGGVPAVPQPVPVPSRRPAQGAARTGDVCLTCHPLADRVAGSRRGYEHFERVHEIVLEQKSDCLGCHGEMEPLRTEAHHIDRIAQTENCVVCH